MLLENLCVCKFYTCKEVSVKLNLFSSYSFARVISFVNEELSYRWNFNARIAQILCLHQRQNSLYDNGKCKKQTKQQTKCIKSGKKFPGWWLGIMWKRQAHSIRPAIFNHSLRIYITCNTIIWVLMIDFLYHIFNHKDLYFL